MATTHIADRYSTDRYNELPHFHEAKRQLETNLDAIPHLGDVICEYDLHESLGVSLLHNHFPLYEGEQLAKRYDPAEKTAYMYPEGTTEHRQAYLYTVAAEGERIAYEPIEVFAPSEHVEEVPALAEILDGREEFLREFATVARRLDVTDTFGLTVLHWYIREFDQTEEMPMEVTDEERRILRVTIEPREKLDPETTTETLWTFTPREEASVGTVGDHDGRFGPAHECSHSCGHTCNHTCNHTCVHTGDVPVITDIPDDVPIRPVEGPEPSKTSWRSRLGGLFG